MAANIGNGIDEATASLKSSGAKAVYIFGSAARLGVHEGSDFDFAVSGLPPANFFKALSAASRVLDRPMDLIDLDEETPFTRYLKAEGELLRVG
ncbi:MAG: nucleotidyltransferase family protein [Pyrinomonadaceae bacterium]